MKRLLVTILTVSFLLAPHCAATAEEQLTALTFKTMYGVDGPFRGATNAIRGIAGDDLAWTVAHSAKGRLTTRGVVGIVVRGLVFKEGPATGTNDEPTFRAVISCLTESGTGTPVVNVATVGFPASTTGDANIAATITLPNPCVAPIIFITGDDATKWFAVTGFENEE